MDALVQWDIGKSVNVVAIDELECVDNKKVLTKGQKVRMLWRKKHYFGTVLEIEEESNLSGSNGGDDDDLLKKYDIGEDEPEDDSDADPNYIQACEVSNCPKEVFSACHICQALLCSKHFLNMGPCNNDHKLLKRSCKKRKRPTVLACDLETENAEILQVIENTRIAQQETERSTVILQPEDFPVEGSPREGISVSPISKRKENKKMKAHKNRVRGKAYINIITGKACPEKKPKPRCNGITCSKLKKECSSLSEEHRGDILKAYYETESLQLQREYIVRFVRIEEVKQKTVNNRDSRRSLTYHYLLPKEGKSIPVCKTMFLNTLNISDKTLRTALAKINPIGTVDKDKRGGRQEIYKARDKETRDAILEHISRFPRMESHYCRKDSKRDYLHPNLNKKTMHAMFLKEYESRGISASYTLYCEVLKSQNISFHHPKKDLCNLCENYRKGSAEKKNELENRFQDHEKEKEAVRKIKDDAKEDTDPHKTVATFDLQQVIILPKTDDNQLFYKRRLSNYNLTVYELKSKACHCFTWHEGQGKRGTSEISTCLKLYLESLKTSGIKEVTLFSDGCPGQNKNSIVPTMLLHSICTLNFEKITLLFFEPNHGQNEGDSAHSAISTAIKNAGDLYVPSQLIPVFRLARKKMPYIVHTLQALDFFYFKTMSQRLRILSVRTDDQGDSVDWTKMRQIMVQKNKENKIFFKYSHLHESFKSITLLGRFPGGHSRNCESPIKKYVEPPKIPKAKYNDLMALCHDTLPTVRLSEYVHFYDCLPHE